MDTNFAEDVERKAVICQAPATSTSKHPNAMHRRASVAFATATASNPIEFECSGHHTAGRISYMSTMISSVAR